MNCLNCDEPIDGPVAWIGSLHKPTPIHPECQMRMIIGGLNHLNKTCTCCGGSEPPDPPDMTPREAARAAVLYWRWQQTVYDMHFNNDSSP